MPTPHACTAIAISGQTLCRGHRPLGYSLRVLHEDRMLICHMVTMRSLESHGLSCGRHLKLRDKPTGSITVLYIPALYLILL